MVVNGILVSTVTEKHAKFGIPLIKIADEIMTQAGITEENESNTLFTKLVETVDKYIPVYNRGSKMYTAVTKMLKNNDIKLVDEDIVQFMFHDLDEELKLDI